MYQKIISVILGFFKKCIDIYSKILYTSKCVKKCTLSSVGQSNRLITGGSKVRILEGAPNEYCYSIITVFIFIKLNSWVGGRVAKGGRLYALLYKSRNCSSCKKLHDEN